MNGIVSRHMIPWPLLASLVAITGYAAEPPVETIRSDLQNPRSLAIRPGGSPEQFEVYIIEAAAGRVVKLQSNSANVADEVITGFDSAATPTNLIFLDRDQIAVTTDNSPSVRVYQLPAQPTPLSATETKQQISLAEQGRVVAVARLRANDKLPDALAAAGMGQNDTGWIGKIPIRAGTLGDFAQWTLTGVTTPTSTVVSPQGFLLVSQRSADNDADNSRLTFINPIESVPVMELTVEIDGVAGLGFSPKSGNLYAIASPSSAAKPAGVYRIDSVLHSGKPACTAVEIAPIDHPTALAFAPDGTLYVTAERNNSETNRGEGALLRLTGEL